MLESRPSSRSSGKGSYRPPVQYSLFRLMVGMTLVAILLGLLVTLSGTIIYSLFFSTMAYIVPAALVACVVYGRGDFQAFAIGAMIPFIGVFIGVTASRPSFAASIGLFVQLIVLASVCGTVTALTRRWIVQQDE
jgi:hypothetical protein